MRLDTRSILPPLALLALAGVLITLGRWVEMIDDRPDW